MNKKTKNDRIHVQTLLWVLLIVGIGCLYVFHMYIIGKQVVAFYDYGSDLKDQYMMWYNGIVNSFRDGNFSTWDFRNGFGMNTMGHNLTEPFLIPIFLLGILFGPEHLTYYMVWMEIARILVAAIVFYFFLSEFEFGENAKLVASVLYAFNAYMMVWGQHYALGSALVYLPLILIFAEHVIQRRRFGIGLCLVSFVTLQSSFYQGYMCMLAGGVYVTIRVIMLENTELADRMKGFVFSAVSMILGVLMAAFRFFPSAISQVGSSGRLETQISLFERLFVFKIWPGAGLKTILYRLFSSCIQGNGNEDYVGFKNFYEAPELFFSTLFVILLLQYLFLLPRMKESKKKILMQYLVVAICAGSVVFMNITTIFNGLYKPFFRHTFVLMPFFGILVAKVMDYILKEKKLSLIALAVAVLGMSAIYLKAYTILPQTEFKNNAMLLWGSGIAMVILLYAYCKDKWLDTKSAFLLLVIVTTVNIVADSFLCYNYRVALTKDHPEYYAETYHSDVDAALDYLEANDPTFYRVEKDYFTAASCLDSLAQDYRGISAYNANQNSGIKDFTAQIWPQLNHERDIYHMQFQNAIWDTTLGALTDVKYVLSKSDQLNLKGYKKINQIGAISIYQNEYTESLGTFYADTITTAQYEENKEQLNTRELLKKVLVTDDASDHVLSEEQLRAYEKKEIHDILKSTVEPTYETTDTLDLEFELNENTLANWKDVIFQFTMIAEKRSVVNVIIDDGYKHFFVENWEHEREIHIEVPDGAKKIRIQMENSAGYVRMSDFTFYGAEKETRFNETAKITVNAPKKDSYLEGQIQTSEDGYVMLTIPFEKGWDVYVDGEKQELLNGDYGFIAFAVEKGEHELQAVFTAPLLKEGILVSIVCTILFLIVCIAETRRKR